MYRTKALFHSFGMLAVFHTSLYKGVSVGLWPPLPVGHDPSQDGYIIPAVFNFTVKYGASLTLRLGYPLLQSYLDLHHFSLR